DIISNRRRLSAEEPYKLAEQFQTDKDFWLNLQALHDAWLTHQK
ncbi:addiction module antidote protein, HigA family, partial [Escherichia coli]|nr:addiction module antidote protein, HigA family [Escherichia coli]